jgi:hypothetical protein
MSFDTSAYLRRATGRAKSDVANKLVSMLLHDVSRKICAVLDANVSDPEYTEAVANIFGTHCCYCGRLLETDRAAVEHLDGMNRFRCGLHIPGNVIVSCTRCNREKRRDDQLEKLVLAASGWESFLSHDSSKCLAGCKTCAYWRYLWPEDSERKDKLAEVRRRILEFRADYAAAGEWAEKARKVLAPEMGNLYRNCQDFAVSQIRASTGKMFPGGFTD